MPMWLMCSPCIFTRLTKFLTAFFRKHGIMVVPYIDDILVLGNSYKDYKSKVKFMPRILKKLGFFINMDKSALVPDRKVIYLGVYIFQRYILPLSLNMDNFPNWK